MASEVDVAMGRLGPRKWVRRLAVGVALCAGVLAATGCGSGATGPVAGADVTGGDAAQVADTGSGADAASPADAVSATDAVNATDAAGGGTASDVLSTSDTGASTDGAPTPDVGADVGAADVGAADVGAPDVGATDASAADAGAVDASSVDDVATGDGACSELTVAIGKELKVVAACAADADCTVLQTGLCPFAGMPCGGVAVNKSQKLDGLQALLAAAAMPCNVAMCKCMAPPSAVCQQGQCTVP